MQWRLDLLQVILTLSYRWRNRCYTLGSDIFNVLSSPFGNLHYYFYLYNCPSLHVQHQSINHTSSFHHVTSSRCQAPQLGYQGLPIHPLSLWIWFPKNIYFAFFSWCLLRNESTGDLLAWVQGAWPNLPIIGDGFLNKLTFEHVQWKLHILELCLHKFRWFTSLRRLGTRQFKTCAVSLVNGKHD